MEEGNFNFKFKFLGSLEANIVTGAGQDEMELDDNRMAMEEKALRAIQVATNTYYYYYQKTNATCKPQV